MKTFFKKSIYSALSVAVLSLTTVTGVSAHEENVHSRIIADQSPAYEGNIGHHVEDLMQVQFASITGVVQETTDFEGNPDMKRISLLTPEGETIHINVSQDTLIVDEWQDGSEIIVFYDQLAPMIMIYPPQYHAEVIALVDADRMLHVAHFDEDLVSADRSLKLNISDETIVLQEDGTVYEGSLGNRELVVFYQTSTRSIPAQTVPERVIVLDEKMPYIVDGGDGEDGNFPEWPDLEPQQADFASISGTITDIVPHGSEQDLLLVTVEYMDGEVVHFVVSSESYVEADLEKGAHIIGFYDRTKPVIMIYPPQYHAVAIVEAKEGSTLEVNRFDEHFLSQDGSLVIHISEDTEITFRDGTPYEGEIANRAVLIEYDLVMLSYPAQTSPKRIVVLEENVESSEPFESSDSDLQSEEESMLLNEGEDVGQKNLIVNGSVVSAPPAFVNDDGIVMVPLRPIMNVLGQSIEWQSATKSIVLGGGIALQIGEDQHELGAAPSLVDSTAYVPLNFFKQVLGFDGTRITVTGITIE